MHSTISLQHLIAASSLAIALTACGGGGGTTSPLPSATAAPTQAAVQTPAQSVLTTSMLLGSNTFVNPTGRTTYVLSADTFNTSACAAAPGCSGLWPAVPPPAGVALSGGFSSFVRSDGTTQLAFNGNPLYTYAGDTGTGQTNGNGITSFGGIWTVARPTLSVAASSPAVPQPTSTPQGGSGY
jgi:predicted lipoprotein with Yx(FWY)xxD motif